MVVGVNMGQRAPNGAVSPSFVGFSSYLMGWALLGAVSWVVEGLLGVFRTYCSLRGDSRG